MSSSRLSKPEISHSSARFLELIRNTYAHDLRTPLSTIVNYAAVLEAGKGTKPEEVTDIGRRIRENAQRAARMIQQMGTATGLATRPQRPVPTDLAALARNILIDAGGEGLVSVLPDRGSACMADVDAEIVSFAWRAYVGVENDAARSALHAVELELGINKKGCTIELRRGPAEVSSDPSAAAEPAGIQGYLRLNTGPARMETSLAFNLAHDLITSQGGQFDVWGRPGVRSGLRLRL